MDVKAIRPTEGMQSVRSTVESDIKTIRQPSVVEPAKYDQENKEKQLDKESLKNLSSQMNKFMEELSAGIQFTVHEKTNSLMVQVVDVAEQKVIKEFPAREFLDTIANIREYVGFLLDKKA